MRKGRKRSLLLTTFDRFYFGFLACFIPENCLHKVAIIFKPATILKFHKALVERKYSKLYSNKSKKTPGRKPQDEKLINLVIEMKAPEVMVAKGTAKNVIPIDNYRWKKHCGGLYKLTVEA